MQRLYGRIWENPLTLWRSETFLWRKGTTIAKPKILPQIWHITIVINWCQKYCPSCMCALSSLLSPSPFPVSPPSIFHPPPLFICFLITKHPNKCRDINFGLSPVFQWDTGMSWQVWWIGGGTFWEIIYVIVLEWVKETLRKDRILCIMDIGYLTKSHGLLSEPKREAVSQNSTSIFHKTFDTKRHIISRTLVPT